MSKQTIKQALANRNISMALNQLVGCPSGGWGETKQAEMQVWEAIPSKADREYTLRDLIEYALTDGSGRWQWREGI